VGVDEERSLQKNGGYTRRFVPRILDAVAFVENPEEQLGETTRDLRTPVANCLEADSGICEDLV
jgi:hypothetical protein